jgi:hypothetical protein
MYSQEPVEAPTATLRSTATIEIEEEEEWQHDAITMTEEDYILKHYAQSNHSYFGSHHGHVPRTSHRESTQHLTATGMGRCTTPEEVERDEMLRFNGQDAATGAARAMQRYLTTQSGSLTKHGGNVYSTCNTNSVRYGDCTQTDLKG